MNEFWPVIVIEGFLAFGGVLLLYWWSMRDIKKSKEKALKNKNKNKNEIQSKFKQFFLSLDTAQTALSMNLLIL